MYVKYLSLICFGVRVVCASCFGRDLPVILHFLLFKNIYSLRLCQCIYSLKEIHNVKQVISTNKDFVSKRCQDTGSSKDCGTRPVERQFLQVYVKKPHYSRHQCFRKRYLLTQHVTKFKQLCHPLPGKTLIVCLSTCVT